MEAQETHLFGGPHLPGVPHLHALIVTVYHTWQRIESFPSGWKLTDDLIITFRFGKPLIALKGKLFFGSSVFHLNLCKTSILNNFSNN